MEEILSGFRDKDRARAVIRAIQQKVKDRKYRIMEVCGGHTITIFKSGIRRLLPPQIKLISGPGCPVCVTGIEFIDHAIALGEMPGLIIATFGDLIRVPGSAGSLSDLKTEGGDVRVCYSPMDALKIAKANPDRQVVFLGIGFETTAPTVASVVRRAKDEDLQNFSVLSAHKTMPAAMELLLKGEELQIDAFLAPGHVSAITGTAIFDFLARDYKTPCVVSGFEPVDMLQSILMIVDQLNQNQATVENQYSRGVKREGNPVALSLLSEVFEAEDVVWRGLGVIPGSGLKLSAQYESYDAALKFPVELPPARENPGCICGNIMRGVNNPHDCKLFAKSCTPEKPAGSCMVSDEGTCATYYKYDRDPELASIRSSAAGSDPV